MRFDALRATPFGLAASPLDHQLGATLSPAEGSLRSAAAAYRIRAI
jgi:hypothetical protein